MVEDRNLNVLLGFTRVQTRTRLFEPGAHQRLDGVLSDPRSDGERELAEVNRPFSGRRLVPLTNDLSRNETPGDV